MPLLQASAYYATLYRKYYTPYLITHIINLLRVGFSSIYLVFLGFDIAFFRDIHTIKEHSSILIRNLAALLNLGAGATDSVDIYTLEPELGSVLVVLSAGDSGQESDNLKVLLTNESVDLDAVGFCVDVNFDGEMFVDLVHLVPEALGDANDHVSNVGSNSEDNSALLVGVQVHGEEEEVKFLAFNSFALLFDVDFNMSEGLGDSSSFSFNRDDSGLYVYLN
jgi:hypothetical protein